MSDNDEFFRERRAQAVLKHGILKRYPVVFASKTGSKWPVVFLDGYAGRGRYEDGSPGSPLLLAKTAERVEAFRDVVGVYVEEDERAFANLQMVMAHRADKDHFFPDELGLRLPQILEIAKGAALFAFLDPFGTALDRQQLVDDLLRRPGPAPVEVLLHVSVSSVARLGGLFRRRREQDETLSPQDEKTIDHLDRFLGGQWWRPYFEPVRDVQDIQRATDAALQVAAEYQRGVCAATGFESVSLPIRRRPDLLPNYILVLFTGHVDGMWCFADALGKAGREWQGAWKTEAATKQLARGRAREVGESIPGLELETLLAPKPFDPDEYERANSAAWQRTIADNIGRLLRTGPFVLARRVDEVYGNLLGLASEKHVRAALKQLHAAGVVVNDGKGKYFFRQVLCPVRQPSGR